MLGHVAIYSADFYGSAFGFCGYDIGRMLFLLLAKSRETMKLRFTIRDMFWLVAVLVLSLGWWLNYQQMQSTIERLRSAAPMVSISDERVDRAMQSDRWDLQ